MTDREKLRQLRQDFYAPGEIKYDSIAYFTSIEKDLEALDILSKYVSFKLYEQDSCYFIQVGNEPLKSITKEEYEILKRWKDDNT